MLNQHGNPHSRGDKTVRKHAHIKEASSGTQVRRTRTHVRRFQDKSSANSPNSISPDPSSSTYIIMWSRGSDENEYNKDGVGRSGSRTSWINASMSTVKPKSSLMILINLVASTQPP